MIKSTMEKHTVRWLKRKYSEELLNFKISIQRKEVWDLEHKSNLVCSLLLGIPIESLLFEEEGKGYKVLDGQQRNLAILKFVNDEYALSSKIKNPIIDGVELVGKKFSDLPQSVQEDILEFELSISVMRPLTDEERELVFFMRNQAVSLTKFELTRVVMGSKILEELSELVKHPFFEKINMSKSALNGYEHQQLVLKCMILEMERKDLSFSGNDINLFAEELKRDGIPQSVKQQVVGVLDYLNSAFPQKNQNLKKIHVPMIFSVAKHALSDQIKPVKFFIWSEKFFEDLDEGKLGKYFEACQSGSAKKNSVLTRLNEMEEHYANLIGKLI